MLALDSTPLSPFANSMEFWLGCDIGGAKELGVIYFPTNWGAKEPQNLPNHRVVDIRTFGGVQIWPPRCHSKIFFLPTSLVEQKYGLHRNPKFLAVWNTRFRVYFLSYTHLIYFWYAHVQPFRSMFQSKQPAIEMVDCSGLTSSSRWSDLSCEWCQWQLGGAMAVIHGNLGRDKSFSFIYDMIYLLIYSFFILHMFLVVCYLSKSVL